jgi:hypothetical protein
MVNEGTSASNEAILFDNGDLVAGLGQTSSRGYSSSSSSYCLSVSIYTEDDDGLLTHNNSAWMIHFAVEEYEIQVLKPNISTGQRTCNQQA